MQSNNCLISVIIPFYNAEKFISSCISTLSNQEYTNFEAIFVDDGSTDGAPEKILACNDSRFQLLHQEKKGVSAARNLGLREARGEYIAFLDVDDELDPVFLSELINAAQNHNADIVMCDYTEVYNDGQLREVKLPWRNEKITRREIENCLLPRMIASDHGANNSIWGLVWRSFVKKEFWERTHIFFDEKVTLAEDMLFLLALYNRADSIYILSKSLYRYNRTAQSALNAYKSDGLEISLRYHRQLISTLKREGLFENNQERYMENKATMYTCAISNLARNPKLLNSVEGMKRLREELSAETFDWRKCYLSKGRKISLWLLEHSFYRTLLVLYRIKEYIRMRNM